MSSLLLVASGLLLLSVADLVFSSQFQLCMQAGATVGNKNLMDHVTASYIPIR